MDAAVQARLVQLEEELANAQAAAAAVAIEHDQQVQVCRRRRPRRFLDRGGGPTAVPPGR
jgi:hypothetical protein